MADDSKAEESLAPVRENKKRKASALGPEERTLVAKQLKAVEPDTVVVVGGTEFYHFKYELCAASEFFDNMLSSGMKEGKENRVELRDKNPDEWPLVFQLLAMGHGHFKNQRGASFSANLQWPSKNLGEDTNAASLV
mgnify:CR=1 FL=1